MKKILIVVAMLSSILLSAETENNNTTKEDRVKKQIEAEIQKEKRYAKEQTFYKGANYNLKGSEVNPDSLSSVPILELDDLDMDSVYD
jgi:uncharacterized membrane protein